jgi:hypothetical protein
MNHPRPRIALQVKTVLSGEDFRKHKEAQTGSDFQFPLDREKGMVVIYTCIF